MLFCSTQFLLFFVVVFTVYWAMPWPRARVWLLLGASFFFYASWNEWLALLICVSTVIDYFLARGIDAWKSPGGRRFLLVVNLVGNLGLLCYFKYANFFLQSLEDGLRASGASASLPVLQVILPVGISFYTFEAINYMVDVYRKKIPAERNLGHFMLFITFFPHLIAGPIVRARDFLPQIRRPKHWDWARLQLGVEYFLMGMFKKLVIADRMVLLVDPVFANPEAYRTHTLWLAVLAFALQIYCDFSGYTDMAIGCAHMLGYKLAPNFNMPYLAANIADFWRRWHMSLSTWLRDYLFIPLGGSRAGEWQTARNLMITMALGGLWHGASWTFVVWGVVHGLLLVGHRLFRAVVRRLPAVERSLTLQLGTAGCIALTFMTICITWIPFRAASFEQMAVMFQRMFTPCDGRATPGTPAAVVLYAYLVVGLCHWVAYQVWFKDWMRRAPAGALSFSYCSILAVALLFAPRTGLAFIYFQF